MLYVVGLASPRYITAYKRLQAYTAAEFNLLLTLLGTPPNLILTPNILTEVSNLLGYPANSRIRLPVNQVIKLLLQRFGETYVPSVRASEMPQRDQLGLTDAALLLLASNKALLLTADLDLFLSAERAGYDAQNFNRIRDAYQ